MNNNKLDKNKFYIIGYNSKDEEVTNISLLKKYMDEKQWFVLGAAIQKFMEETRKSDKVRYVKCGYPRDLSLTKVMLGGKVVVAEKK